MEGGEPTATGGETEGYRRPSPFLMRAAVRVSRAGWFRFLRRLFRHQNSPASDDLPPRPFNSRAWLSLEMLASVIQVILIAGTIAASPEENPVWPLRLWVVSYSLATLLGLPLLYRRYGHLSSESGPEQQGTTTGKRALDLFFAVWFVTGNVWVVGSRYGAFGRAPRLHVLCMGLLAWNAARYSLPFLLFVLLCCCVPAASRAVGFNINAASDGRGATDDSISKLPHWRFVDGQLANSSTECCICLSRYKGEEEVRQLPCSHYFHLGCVDQWLRITSSCPLCKSDLDNSMINNFV